MKKRTLLKRLKKIGPLRLMFLIVMIASNSFAWFIYATKIDSTVDVHVRAWNVVFEAEDNEITSVINFPVDSIYPGMSDFEYEITAYNNSEVSARLVYVLLEANILGTQYVTVEGRAERGETASSGDMTSSELEDMLAEDYPFSITIDVSNDFIDEEDGIEQYTFNVTWPYEQNDDEEDTYWGVAAYNYKESNPGDPSITLKVKIIITQNLDQGSGTGSGSGSGSGTGSEPEPEPEP